MVSINNSMKVDMKSTEYYKSGKHIEHNRQASVKAKEKNHAMKQERIVKYNKNPKLCKHCEESMPYEKRHNKFCSKSCSANYNNIKRTEAGWTHSEETRKKISEANTGKKYPDRVGNRLNEHNKYVNPSVEKFNFEQVKIQREEKRKERIMNTDWNVLGWDLKRQRIIYEQENKCNHCGIDEWHGKKLTLEIDHKDGDNKNNERENLEGLCPNCHSITDTWRGRNKEKVQKSPSVSNEEKVKAYLETGNIHQALIKLGLAPKGNNYGQMKKALTEWGIKYQ